MAPGKSRLTEAWPQRQRSEYWSGQQNVAQPCIRPTSLSEVAGASLVEGGKGKGTPLLDAKISMHSKTKMSCHVPRMRGP